jgi:hypothetical protein
MYVCRSVCRCYIYAGDIDGQHVDSDSVLLSHLQHMQHLTHLSLEHNLWALSNDSSEEEEEQQQQQQQQEGWLVGPPAEAYAALTASSTLQHLNIKSCRMPIGAWQHMSPIGRQLPHLTELNISNVQYAKRGIGVGVRTLPPLEGTRLVSCFPSLRVLNMQHCRCSTGLLSALQGLTGLVRLKVGHYGDQEESLQSWKAVCQLTGVRELGVVCPSEEGLLLQLTQLKQLTRLEYEGLVNEAYGCVTFTQVIGLITYHHCWLIGGVSLPACRACDCPARTSTLTAPMPEQVT